jgi:hypothetical protein
MLSNAFKLLALAMAIICVAARPEFEEFPQETEADEMNVEVPETGNDEADNVEMDGMSKRKTKPFPVLSKPCPFNCKTIAIVKFPFIWGKPPPQYFLFWHHGVYNCCQKACSYYQGCLNSNKPAWLCYLDTLDIICKCRNLKPHFKITVEQTRGK